ncbi:cytidine/deoxycytidylate deaminase family protein [bacterium]|nr:cytidine/deoxycytidylate deaminase family protein [bacterium]
MENDGYKRPSWDEYFMHLAYLVSTRSTCLRRKVGAILVRDRRIISTGYNGAPTGIKHCLEVGCLRDQLGIPSGERQEICRGLHAEQNAIIQAARFGVSTVGATLYCTTQPCITCSKMLINAGIVRIVVVERYPDTLAEKMLREAGIPVEFIKIQSQEE